MLDHTTRATRRLQRTKGRAHVGMTRAGLRDLHQAGSAKAILPKIHTGDPEVVFLNTAGGLTGGDALTFSLDVGGETSVVGTTQTAERAYASIGGHAKMDVALSVGENARLDWLPQETIIFNNSALVRNTNVDLATGARFLFVETIILGRAAMGETVEDLLFRDTRKIRRNGIPIFIEPIGLTGDILRRRNSPATLSGASVFCTIGLFAPDAETNKLVIDRIISQSGLQAATSAWDGKLIVRAMANDGLALRKFVVRSLNALRARPLPRVWQN